MTLISLVAIICGLLTVLMLFLIYKVLVRYHINLFHALRHYMDKVPPPQTLMDYKAVKVTVAFVKRLAALLPQTSFSSKLDLKLRRAGLPLLGTEYIVATTLVAAIFALVALTLTLKLSWAVGVFLLTILVSALLLQRLIQRRRDRLINQLGDCLTTVANALRAGFSFVQAMDLVSREMEPPISDEFAHVMRDVSYGMLLPEALEDMDKRVGVEELHLVITAVLIQREIGGNLAQVLDNIRNTITERIRQRREIMTLTAQGRASAWIVSFLPIFIAAGMLLVDSTHFDELLKSKFGMMILGAAVCLEIVGFIVIQKIVNIKVD